MKKRSKLEAVKKRKYDSDDSKRRLLRAGIEVFSKEGYDKAATRKIAKVAGVNDSLIHRYFHNKLGLCFAILKQFHEHMVEEPPYPPAESLEEELIGYFKYRMEFLRREKKFLKFFVTRSILDPKVRGVMQSLVKDGKSAGLVVRLELFQRQGKLRSDVNVEYLSFILKGLTFSMALLSGIIFDLEASVVEGALETSAKVLSAGLKPK
jgi:AcrR family transcriptional regulator